jgi:hypothetical protein
MKIGAKLHRLSEKESSNLAKYFVRVDVTEEFPFLVTKLLPYFNV